MRFAISLNYNGSSFSGWQKQPNAISIQETIEVALSTLLRNPMELTGCGRTDAGVHARNYIAHLDADFDILQNPKLLYQLNALLPYDISINSCTPVADNFHARFDAVSRSYIYRIHSFKDPFAPFYSAYIPQFNITNADEIQAFISLILSTTDFFAFCKSDSGLENYNCIIQDCKLVQQNNHWEFHITANRFVRGMVRLIVGAIIQISQEKITVDQIKKHIAQHQLLPFALSAPANGLTLELIVYQHLDLPSIIAQPNVGYNGK